MLRFLLKRVLKEIYDIDCEVLDCLRTVNWRNTCNMCTKCSGTSQNAQSWRDWAKAKACTVWRKAVEEQERYGRGRSAGPPKKKKKKPEWQAKGSVSPPPSATRAKGDGLVDRVKSEKANRERRSSSKTPQQARSSKDRDVSMQKDYMDSSGSTMMGTSCFSSRTSTWTTRTTSPTSSTSAHQSSRRSPTFSFTDCLRCFDRPTFRPLTNS